MIDQYWLQLVYDILRTIIVRDIGQSLNYTEFFFCDFRMMYTETSEWDPHWKFYNKHKTQSLKYLKVNVICCVAQLI